MNGGSLDGLLKDTIGKVCGGELIEGCNGTLAT